MNAYAPRLVSTLRRLAGNVRRKHDEFRMEHFMYSLPEDIRKDIGWPDIYADRRSRGGWN